MRDVSSSESGLVNYVAEVAIADLSENFTAQEQALMLPIPEPIPADCPHTPDSYNEAIFSANYPINSLLKAMSELKYEQRMHWTHLERSQQRRGQNRINKYISRWKKYFFLETAEDYYILADAIRRKREGLRPQRIGKQRNPSPHSKFLRLVSD